MIVELIDELDESGLRDVAGLIGGLVRAGAALGWVEAPTLDEVREAFGGLFDRREGALVAALDQGRVAGVAYWKRYARPTHRPHADVEKVAVDAGLQGRGVGRRMLTLLVEAARRAGVEVLTLDMRDGNPAAAALYESLGFRVYGRLERFVAFGDERWDKIFYALDLRAG